PRRAARVQAVEEAAAGASSGRGPAAAGSARSGRPPFQAPLSLAGQVGARSRDRVVGARIRSRGAAHPGSRRQRLARAGGGGGRALAEMSSKAAVKPLASAIRDPSNGAALSELLAAIVKIDPQNGPKEVVPFLTNSAGRVREAAMRVMPNPLDPRYVEDAAQL